MAAQGHPQLGANRAVVAIEIDRRQALVLEPPAADPCLRQRQSLPGAGLAAPDHHEPIALHISHQQGLVGSGAASFSGV